MFFKAIVCLSSIVLQSAAANDFNGNMAVSSAGLQHLVTDEPIDYPNVHEDSGSNFNSKSQIGHEVADLNPSRVLDFDKESSGMENMHPRSFVRLRHLVTDEPIDLNEHTGGGSNKSQMGHRVVNKSSITQDGAHFLTSSLLTIFIPSFYTLVFVISVPLNTVAVVLFTARIRPKKPAVIYMLNLAMADLLFVLLLPFKMSYHFNGNNWIYGPAMCRIVTAAFYCNMYCSILLMMCISLDRFIAVRYPFKSLEWRSQKSAMVVCSTMWLLATIGVVPILAMEQTLYLPELNITTCHDVLDIDQQQGYYLYFFPIFSSVFFFVPLVVTAVCYVLVIRALGGPSVGNRSNRTRALIMAATVLTVFVVGFTPTNVMLLVHYLQFARHYSDSSYIAYLLSVCLGSISCCLDPLIYYFGSAQCRKQVAGILCSRATPETRQSSKSNSTSTRMLSTFQDNADSQYKKLMASSNVHSE